MGLSIHYSGSFNASASLQEMIVEVKDIVEIYKWKYFVFETDFPESGIGEIYHDGNLYGISFSPPNCEPVSISFLSNRKMSGATQLMLYGNSIDQNEIAYLYMISTKTQYAGIEIHKMVIHLLKYISSKYLIDFTLSDEGQYWETGNAQLLHDIFKRYTDLINNVSFSMESQPFLTGETIEAYFERLLNNIYRDKE